MKKVLASVLVAPVISMQICFGAEGGEGMKRSTSTFQIAKIEEGKKDDGKRHSSISEEEFDMLRQLAKAFGAEYDKYYDRVVIDISYPALKEFLIQTADEDKADLTKESEKERVEKIIGEIDAMDWSAVRPIISEHFDIREEDENQVVSLLNDVWDNATGKQRIQSLILLTKLAKTEMIYIERIATRLGTELGKIQKVRININTEGGSYADRGEIWLSGWKDEKGGRKITTGGETLLHELSHVYHLFVLGDFLHQVTYITRRDEKLNRRLFPDVERLRSTEKAKAFKKMLEERSKTHKGSKCQLKDLGIELIVAGVVDGDVTDIGGSEERKWRNLEEMLTITGVGPLDLKLVEKSDGQKKICKYLVTDRQNENAYHARQGEGEYAYHTTTVNSRKQGTGGIEWETELVDNLNILADKIGADREKFRAIEDGLLECYKAMREERLEALKEINAHNAEDHIEMQRKKGVEDNLEVWLLRDGVDTKTYRIERDLVEEESELTIKQMDEKRRVGNSLHSCCDYSDTDEKWRKRISSIILGKVTTTPEKQLEKEDTEEEEGVPVEIRWRGKETEGREVIYVTKLCDDEYLLERDAKDPETEKKYFKEWGDGEMRGWNRTCKTLTVGYPGLGNLFTHMNIKGIWWKHKDDGNAWEIW